LTLLTIEEPDRDCVASLLAVLAAMNHSERGSRPAVGQAAALTEDHFALPSSAQFSAPFENARQDRSGRPRRKITTPPCHHDLSDLAAHDLALVATGLHADHHHLHLPDHPSVIIRP